MPPTKKTELESNNDIGSMGVSSLGQPEGQLVDTKDTIIADLYSRLQALEDQNKIKVPKRVTERIVRVMFHEDKPIIKFGNTKVRKVDNEDKLFIDFSVMNEDETITEIKDYDYLDLLNTKPRFQADLLSQEVKTETIPQGGVVRYHKTVPADMISVREGKATFEPRNIVLEETRPFYSSKIRFLEGPWNGKEINVKNECLNP